MKNHEVIPMKNSKLFAMVKLLLAPVLIMLLGLVLVLNPDSASVLISRVVGWAVTIGGIGCALGAVFSSQGRVGKIISAVIFIGAGMWLNANPLMLASAIGRFVGIFLLINGLQDLRQAWGRKQGMLIPALVTAAGLALTLLIPLSVSRLVFSLCGVVILAVGAVMAFDRLKNRRWLGSGDDDIIDAL